MVELSAEFSLWYLILCAVLAGLYTFFLYRKNKQIEELNQTVVWLLRGLRFSTVFITSLLLVNLFLVKWVSQSEEPVIVIVQDVSESILNSKDSTFYSEKYPQLLAKLKSELSDNYKVASVQFGGGIVASSDSLNFNQKRTNFAIAFDEIDARYAGSNVAAVVFASDGLFNIGANPKYYSFKETYPIYTIGLGDTSQKSDIAVKQILANDLVYLGNSFPVEVSVTANLLKGEKAELKVFHNGEVVSQKILDVTSNHQLFAEEFVFEADVEGTQRYSFSVTKFDNELNFINNTQNLLIDVLDNRDRVLVVANAPHPDIAAIKGVLLQKESLDVKVVLTENLKENFDSYNLIIAHGFGGPKHMDVWAKIKDSKVPFWGILYGKTNMNQLSGLQLNFNGFGNGKQTNRVYGVFNSEFNLFNLSDESKSLALKAPPITSPFADLDGIDESNVLLFQKIGTVTSPLPLLYFDKKDQRKTAWLFGDGLWRWKYYNYLSDNSHDAFNELIWKTVQFLSVKEDKSRFRVKSAKHFLESENVILQAELYNESYELINSTEVKMALTNENGDVFNYVFNSAGNSYALNIGKLPYGIYTYKVEVNDSRDKLVKNGSFIVKEVNVEWSKVSADFSVLQDLSSRTGGEFFVPSELDELKKVFDDSSTFPVIPYSIEKKQSVLNEKWIFILILLLLTTEWLIRKYKGRY
jgi:hypothetical protein